MKKHSKILCLALSLLMMLSLLPTVVFAETPTKLTKITVEIDTPYLYTKPTFKAKIISSAEVTDIANGNYYIDIAKWESYNYSTLGVEGTYYVNRNDRADCLPNKGIFLPAFAYAMKADSSSNYGTSSIPVGYVLADDTEVKIVDKNGTVYVDSMPLSGRDATNTTDISQLIMPSNGAKMTVFRRESNGTEVQEDYYPGPGAKINIDSADELAGNMIFSHWETDTDVVFDNKYLYDTTVTAPNPKRDITIRAIYANKSTEYGITATDGTVKVNGTAKNKAYAGNFIELKANTAPAEKVFDKWVITGFDTTGLDLTKEELSFNMPASAVTATATYKSPVAPTITAGANQEWTKGTTTGLAVTSDADFAKFTEVKVDGATIDATNYEVVSGSTKVTLKPAYLETLADGTHTLDIVSTDGTASTSFTIKVAAVTPGGNSNSGNKPNPDTGVTSPQTGDSSNVLMWIAILFVSLVSMAITAVFCKKRRTVE